MEQSDVQLTLGHSLGFFSDGFWDMGSVRFLSSFNLMTQWEKLGPPRRYSQSNLILTLDTGFLEPALDAGFAEALDAGLTDAFDAGLAFDTGLDAALEVG